MDVKNHVRHHHARQLLHNKFIVVLGDSIQRSVYKDIVLLLQKDNYLSAKQLKTKGEASFEGDAIVEGGCLTGMHNGTGYREVRQFRSDHHLVRFYFVTRIYSGYMRSVLEDFRLGVKPDILVVNSCVWDISRYGCHGIGDYRDNVQRFFFELKEVLPEETLVIWNLTMPLGERIKGGFLVPEIEHRAPLLRHDVVEANFYSGALAHSHQMDVLDLHYHFRRSLQHRTKDGVHWNALAHRWITCLLLRHIAQAWGVTMPPPQTAAPLVERNAVADRPQSAGGHQAWRRQEYRDQSGVCAAAPSQPLFRGPYGGDLADWAPYRSEPRAERPRRHHDHRSYVLRHRHVNPHYTPYPYPYPPLHHHPYLLTQRQDHHHYY